ncbi:hypothetical protein TNCV_2435261 [Trichonephila clavipes]|nr:hypothetical protein TNCV_2435261 [Trichonephila clavipes]
MRSGDLFLEASSVKQATALINLQKLAHLDVTVAPHSNLNFRVAIPKTLSRDFHRKIEDDTLTGDCSEEDEDLMDIQSGPSTSSSKGGASAAQ